MNYIVGCGGVGSWLAPSLAKLVPGQVTVIDGDTIENRNLDRQLFSFSEIGENKAKALGTRYGLPYIDNWFGPYSIEGLSSLDCLIVCADNNKARVVALQESDRAGCHVIIAANEVSSAEAYYYDNLLSGTLSDPRVYYPELLSDPGVDPMLAAAGCTGPAQEANVQLVSANFMAASLAQWLFLIWEHNKLWLHSPKALPTLVRSNGTNFEVVKTELKKMDNEDEEESEENDDDNDRDRENDDTAF